MYPQAKLRTPIWPYIGVVICLFLLTVLAPRSWQSIAVSRFAESMSPLAEQDNQVDIPFESPAAVVLAPKTQTLATKTQTLATKTQTLATKTQTRSVAPFTAETGTINRLDPKMATLHSQVHADVAHSPAVSRPVAGPLSQLESPSQIAEVAPPVAERIELDRSVADTPALPLNAEAAAGLPKKIWLPRTARLVEPSTTGRVPIVDSEESRFGRVWPYPTALMDQLRGLQNEDPCRTWSADVQDAIVQICKADSVSERGVADQLKRLSELAEQANTLVRHAPAELRAKILRVGYSVERRGVVWQLVYQVASTGGESIPVARHRKLGPVLDMLEQHMVEGRLDAWHRYLKIDELRLLDQSSDVATRRGLARYVLARMDLERVNRSQRQVLVAEPLQQFATALRNWASEPIDGQQLLEAIEAYETSGQGQHAHQVVRGIQATRWSSNHSASRLAETLNRHYRNANLRVAITDELLNRRLPEQEPIEEPIEEDFLGAWVSGTSQVSTRLNVTLIPDPLLWRIGVEAKGEVQSHTLANKWPASFCSEGTTPFLARKLLLVDRDGVRVRFAEAGAESDTQLQWLATEYDGIPLVGWLVRNLALQEHGERYYEAQREASARVEQRASSRLDDEVHAQLRRFERDFQEKILVPLNQLQLDPMAVDMQTTDDRLIVRYRLSGSQQLAAHTPRPQAPGDSWVSIQLHESLLNNTVEQLKLSGRRSDLRTLFRELADTLKLQQWQVPDDIPEGVTIQFAVQDPVRVTFDDGRVVVTLRIAELSNGRRRWRNFSARALYLPDVSQLSANLVRDDVIRVPEGRLRFFDQIAIRGIFSKVFSKKRPVNLISGKLAEDPTLAGLQVNQFVIRDGWIGASLGPERADEMQHFARQPDTQRR